MQQQNQELPIKMWKELKEGKEHGASGHGEKEEEEGEEQASSEEEEEEEEKVVVVMVMVVVVVAEEEEADYSAKALTSNLTAPSCRHSCHRLS